MSDQVVNLYRSLEEVGLVGKNAFKFGSPDEIVLVSGGPYSHLSKLSIICGPSNTRVTIRQPSLSLLDANEKHSPLDGEISLAMTKSPFTAEIEEWQHGCWYRSNSLFAKDIADLFEQLKKITPKEKFETISNHFTPNKPFWSGSFAYDMVQWTQPIALQHVPEEGDLLGVLWLIDKYIVHSNEDDLMEVITNNNDWRSLVENEISQEQRPFSLIEQPKNDYLEIPSHTDKEHIEILERIKQSIADGQVYQVNFGRFWTSKLIESPKVIFYRLLKSNPAPFSTYISAEDLGFAIVSSSPESLLKCQNGFVHTSPIKGTCERGNSIADEKELREIMIEDVKERSEHRMLVDLMRNDLSAVCEVGSVNIERFDVETYSNVQHLVSHIKGKLLPEENGLTAFNSIFPGGSITGCPRTMVCAVIDEIEMQPRSFWTGSAGWIDVHSGDCSWNILIRTLQATYKNNTWHGSIGAGGGITIKSNTELEVLETYWKAEAIRSACGWILNDKINILPNELSIYPLEIEQQDKVFNNPSGRVFRKLDNQTNLVSCGVLLIDNLDSFTLNIAHAIAGIGHNVTILNGRGEKADIMSDPSNLYDMLDVLKPSHIIIGPGPGTPKDSNLSMAIASHALAGQIDVSILGICLGHQALGLADNNNIIKSPNGAIHGTKVLCHHDGLRLFTGLESPHSFTRYNSLTVDKKSLNGTLKICATDENNEIMALYHPNLPIFGIQFHPESIGSTNGLKLLENFLGHQSDA